MTQLSSALALRSAVFQRLAGDAALSALLGGPRIYDEPPRAALPPYVVLAEIETRDLSGDVAPAHEHVFALEVWSLQGGLSEALKAAERVVRLVDGAALELDGVRLANLAWISTEAERLVGQDLRRAAIRFRAVTEPAALSDAL
ncbi:DUF3168 domain-containing protein [Hansschlegelia sp.]|uniref:DUF3168 domain-containing protein n=1 Tax=Hansschlegelia sp. TaxID=2041892 RepID=UPI002C481FC0|nr:DUF3168 domain-containing protein [Hansschlegelia sp.]HVI28176.1 DUF3168 domain-containing protein [Hansschlegelia sp.]